MWVRNISSTPLTEAQVKILLQGPYFAIVPKSPPAAEYMASIEHAQITAKTRGGGRAERDN